MHKISSYLNKYYNKLIETNFFYNVKMFLNLCHQVLLEPESLVPNNPVYVKENNTDNTSYFKIDYNSKDILLKSSHSFIILGIATISFINGNYLLKDVFKKTFILKIIFYSSILFYLIYNLGNLCTSYFSFIIQKKYNLLKIYSIKIIQLWQLSCLPFIFWTPLAILIKLFLTSAGIIKTYFITFSFFWLIFWHIAIFILSIQNITNLKTKILIKNIYYSYFFILFFPIILAIYFLTLYSSLILY